MLSTARALHFDINSPELAKLGELIENSLTHDWVLRVEHARGGKLAQNDWKLWRKPAFAIREAAAVLADVAECHLVHPTHAIRLYAEKMRPSTRMIYCVYPATERSSPRLQMVPSRTGNPVPA